MVDWGEEKPNGEFWMVNGGLRRSRCGGWGKFWMLDVGFIQNSKLLIQNSGFWCRRGRRRSEVGWNSEFSIVHSKFAGCAAADGGEAGEDFRCQGVEFGECEALFSKVFHRGSEVVEVLLIDDEEPIVEALEGLDRDGWVLGVVLFEIQGELTADFARENGGAGGSVAFGELQQNGLVHIVVHEEDRAFRLADEGGYEGVGIEYLAVEKDALRGGMVAVVFECGEDSVEFLIAFGNVLDLFCFNIFHPLKKGGILKQKFPHFNKRIHNADADINGGVAVKNG